MSKYQLWRRASPSCPPPLLSNSYPLPSSFIFSVTFCPRPICSAQYSAYHHQYIIIPNILNNKQLCRNMNSNENKYFLKHTHPTFQDLIVQGNGTGTTPSLDYSSLPVNVGGTPGNLQSLRQSLLQLDGGARTNEEITCPARQ